MTLYLLRNYGNQAFKGFDKRLIDVYGDAGNDENIKELIAKRI